MNSDTTRFPQRLHDGYRAFRAGRLTTEQSRYRDLAERGQAPETMVVGCCDSRVSPEVIFDAGPGELFVVRNVANLVPPYAPDGAYHGVSAALEYAVAGAARAPHRGARTRPLRRHPGLRQRCPAGRLHRQVDFAPGACGRLGTIARGGARQLPDTARAGVGADLARQPGDVPVHRRPPASMARWRCTAPISTSPRASYQCSTRPPAASSGSRPTDLIRPPGVAYFRNR